MCRPGRARIILVDRPQEDPMYLPRWFVYAALAIAGLVLGWCAQSAALAAPAPTVLPQRLADTVPAPAAGSPAGPLPSSGAETAGALTDADLVTASAASTSSDPLPGSSPPLGDAQSTLTPRQSLAATTRATAAEDEQDATTADLDLPWYHLLNPLVLFGMDRTVDIAGFEDHSINVAGSGQFVVYDDSNLFVNRSGKINSNTGDTDSAGLNAVDTVDSDVSSGPHCDDGCDDESIIGAEHGHFDEADGGDDEDEEEDEDSEEASDERVGAFALALDAEDPRETRDEADTGDEPTQPIDPGGVEIGGDGWDDLAVRLAGRDNVIVYDDSNVVFGGTGDVNAQIGDSDTGGTVTMHTVRSTIRGGVSR
jgi:hypothetical protein